MAEIKYSNEYMPSDQEDRYIRYLVDKINELDLDKRAMELAVEEIQSMHDSMMESLSRLQSEMAEPKGELSAERSKRKSAESKSRKLEQMVKFAQKNQYGDKRQKARLKEDDPEDTTFYVLSKCSKTRIHPRLSAYSCLYKMEQDSKNRWKDGVSGL